VKRTTIMIAAIIAVLIACGPVARDTPRQRLSQGMPPHGPEIDAACELTVRRCTVCHDIERILAVKPTEPLQWERTIGRMRRMRGSGISQQDGHAIQRCLVFRSFGPSGLRGLDP
jgi:hypothetical protein